MEPIIAFAASTTNIFPIANSKRGGQLLTEFNLRSRESVGVGPVDADDAIKYMSGMSFTHSDGDYNVTSSGSILQISKGKALVDGFFVENLIDISIDMIEYSLKGDLSVGLLIVYSSEPTMSGSIMVENETTGYFEGIRVVILPKNEFKLPTQEPADKGAVTAHLKLADIKYINGTIISVVNNPEKSCNIDASRIKNIDSLLSEDYLTKAGLQPGKFYTFASKDANPDAGQDTWCDSTGSMMVWDNDPELVPKPAEVSLLSAPEFGVTTGGVIQFGVPHKQIDGYDYYYPDMFYPLPVAGYSSDSPGTVNAAYTKQVKKINERVDQIYQMPAGKQRQYLKTLESIKDLPALNPNWNIGDYVFVEQDLTLGVTNLAKYPATLYVVIPGMVKSIEYIASISGLTGVEINRIESNTQPSTEDSGIYNSYWGIANSISSWKGIPDEDYFTYVYITEGTSTLYHYKVTSANNKEYSSEPVLVTGEVPLAQEDVIGGFYNVPETALDYGYIIRDSEGRLRLLDYELLRSGILAYQLGRNISIPSNLDEDDIQYYLNEYVNQRVAFPLFEHAEAAVKNNENPNVIHIDLVLPDSASNIDIYDIDSRFNSSIYLHILGTGNSDHVINIHDCAKIRIDSNISGTPTINIARSNLYYDANILNRLNSIQDLRLWYEKFESGDPDLLVDNMTVRELEPPSIHNTNEIDPWSTDVPNDNHFMYALRSLTFNSSGVVIGCSIVVKNDTTANIELGKYIIRSSFELPQSSNLTYPEMRMNKKLKIIGTFITAYPGNTSQGPGYFVMDTKFTALSDEYDPDQADSTIKGSIAFYIETSEVTNILPGLGSGGIYPDIEAWQPPMWNEFSGSAL